MGRYGLSSTVSSPDFARQLSLESSKAQAAFANHGRIALGETQCALGEYSLVRRAAQQAARPEIFVVIGIHRGPAEFLLQVLGRGLLNQRVLGVVH